MITFTPLSGPAGTIRTVPLAYLLQVDDVRILLDCGSPDWCPEPPAGDADEKEPPPWENYCDALKEYVFVLLCYEQSLPIRDRHTDAPQQSTLYCCLTGIYLMPASTPTRMLTVV